MSLQIISKELNKFNYKTEVHCNICTIKNSNQVPQAVIESAITALNYCPIFSENRINAQVRFTVVPYAMGRRFLAIPCK